MIGNVFSRMRQIRQLLLLLPLTLFAFLPAHAGHKPPQLLLRIYVQTSGDGLPATQVTTITVPPNGEQILIRTIPEVSEHDLADVRVDAAGSTYLILTHRGKVNLDAVTGQNQGRLLVVMLNGYVIYAPVIDEQLSSGVFIIPHPLPPEVIKALQDIAKDNIKNGQPQLGP